MKVKSDVCHNAAQDMFRGPHRSLPYIVDGVAGLVQMTSRPHSHMRVSPTV
ncbi:hypothetical protein J6590_011739 [Homalodisca vitripennis]|nr:hypothetical protein J6590_011739 [Homalodisca vitripennis]